MVVLTMRVVAENLNYPAFGYSPTGAMRHHTLQLCPKSIQARDAVVHGA